MARKPPPDRVAESVVPGIDRSDWPLRKVTDPEEQQRETYRYWASKTVGERLEAVWAATQAAYAIQLDQKPAKKPAKTTTRVGRKKR
jgi:hypothetical protein